MPTQIALHRSVDSLYCVCVRPSVWCNWCPCQSPHPIWPLTMSPCPMSLAMASLVSWACLHLAIYTLQQTHLHQKTIFWEKSIYFFPHILCKLFISLSFVFKLKFWILFTQRVRGCQFIPVSTNNLASNVDLISNSRSAVSRSWFLFSVAREQERH